MKSATIIIPTYNEAENLPLLVAEIVALDLNLGMIVVDDNSPDGTGDVADALARKNRQVQVIHRPGKLGLGTAHVAGMQEALEQGAAAILTMDADFSHHPRYIPAVLDALEACDLVIGSRYAPGGGTRYCTWPRRALSRGANLFAHLMLGLSSRDATAGFRGYRRVVLESVRLDAIFSEGYSFLIELLYRCHQQGWQIGEVPIVFENRQRGASKISRTEIARALYTVCRLGAERLWR